MLAIGFLSAAKVPEAEISNGLVRAKLYLPDARSGFYCGTRFDWSGVIYNLEYRGHNYFGPWFKTHDPGIRDIEFKPDINGFAAGTPSASMGPVEEFSNPIGYSEAAAGGTFIKVGVGILRKPDEPKYAWYTRYEIVDPGQWTVHTRPDAVEFLHEVKGTSGYAYAYRKTVRLSKGKPELVLEHSLKNTGKQRIETPVYAHNFFVKVRGKEIAFLRELEKDERAMVPVAGFRDDPKDYDIRVENSKTGAGVRITADRPLARMAVWAIRPTRCPEPFINLRVEPGSEFAWRISYEFYVMGRPQP
jgi:hypothetical protein